VLDSLNIAGISSDENIEYIMPKDLEPKINQINTYVSNIWLFIIYRYKTINLS
jgi:hypothetical protein